MHLMIIFASLIVYVFLGTVTVRMCEHIVNKGRKFDDTLSATFIFSGWPVVVLAGVMYSLVTVPFVLGCQFADRIAGLFNLTTMEEE